MAWCLSVAQDRHQAIYELGTAERSELKTFSTIRTLAAIAQISLPLIFVMGILSGMGVSTARAQASVKDSSALKPQQTTAMLVTVHGNIIFEVQSSLGPCQEGELVVHDQAMVSMSLHHAKARATILVAYINQFEQQQGKLSVPTPEAIKIPH